jgi:excisionase family DNA binding protein
MPYLMSTIDKVLYTKREASHLLSISLRSLDYLIVSQQLPTRRIGRRVLIHRDSIEQFARTDHMSIHTPEAASVQR